MTKCVVRIRPVQRGDLDACAEIEEVAYGGHGATRERIERRIREYPEGFRVAVSGKEVVGFINSGCVLRESISNGKLKDLVGHDPSGKNRVIFSVAVHPAYQGRGIGRQLMEKFIQESHTLGKARILLICRGDLFSFYEQFGFAYRKPSRATYGGHQWHEMSLDFQEQDAG